MQRPDSADGLDVELSGHAHLAVSVGAEAAVDSLSERLRADGHPAIDGPRVMGDGYDECVVLDPVGNRVEITT